MGINPYAGHRLQINLIAGINQPSAALNFWSLLQEVSSFFTSGVLQVTPFVKLLRELRLSLKCFEIQILWCHIQATRPTHSFQLAIDL
jgi:hypothetical protein